MVEAVGEPDALQIDLEGTELVRVVRHLRIGIDQFQDATHQQVILAILVEGDIPAKKCRFGETVNKPFLPKRQFLKTVQTVTEQLQVCEPLVLIVEIHESARFELCFFLLTLSRLLH